MTKNLLLKATHFEFINKIKIFRKKWEVELYLARQIPE
jgi:hypothetical protein